MSQSWQHKWEKVKPRPKDLPRNAFKASRCIKCGAEMCQEAFAGRRNTYKTYFKMSDGFWQQVEQRPRCSRINEIEHSPFQFHLFTPEIDT